MESVWLLCWVVVVTLAVLGVAMYVNWVQASKAAHHLKRFLEVREFNSQNIEHLQAHVEDFKVWSKKFKKTAMVALGILTLLAAVYLLVSFLLI